MNPHGDLSGLSLLLAEIERAKSLKQLQGNGVTATGPSGWHFGQIPPSNRSYEPPRCHPPPSNNDDLVMRNFGGLQILPGLMNHPLFGSQLLPTHLSLATVNGLPGLHAPPTNPIFMQRLHQLTNAPPGRINIPFSPHASISLSRHLSILDEVSRMAEMQASVKNESQSCAARTLDASRRNTATDAFPKNAEATPLVKLMGPSNLFDLHQTKQSSGPEPFPERLHRLLAEVEAIGRSDVISFTPNGRAFQIHEPDTFSEEIIPEYFKQSKLSSFKRQLNLYGFKLITKGPFKGGYHHPDFQKERPDILWKIKRNDLQTHSKNRDCDINDTTAPDFYSMPPILSHKEAKAQKSKGTKPQRKDNTKNQVQKLKETKSSECKRTTNTSKYDTADPH